MGKKVKNNKGFMVPKHTRSIRHWFSFKSFISSFTLSSSVLLREDFDFWPICSLPSGMSDCFFLVSQLLASEKLLLSWNETQKYEHQFLKLYPELRKSNNSPLLSTTYTRLSKKKRIRAERNGKTAIGGLLMESGS